LVLTDCLHRAGEEKVDQIWDFATLTGAVAAALGHAYAGLFTDDDILRGLLIEAGQNSGEGVWPLPLVRENESSLRHNLADLNNMSTELEAKGTHAANFLKQFVPDGVRWAHVDIAGTARHDRARRYLATGGSGFGVRLIVEALRLMTEGKHVDQPGG
jgi:leucyl aminopeptidase